MDFLDASDGEFKKILDTFLDKQTTDLHSRQAALLQVLIETYNNGFRICHLPLVEQILAIAYEKIESGVDALIDPVCAVITHCSQPYVRVKSNEEFTHPQSIQPILKLLGSFLTAVEPQVQVAAAETLRIFAIGTCLSSNTRPTSIDARVDDQRPLARDYSQQLIERCNIAQSAASSLRQLLDDLEENSSNRGPSPTQSSRMDLLLFPIVDLIQDISGWGPNAQILTRVKAHDCILEILDNIEDLRDEFLPLCLEILWNLLETCQNTIASINSCVSRAVLLEMLRTTNAVNAMGSQRSLQILHKLLTRLLVHGYRKQDKELRNTTIMILNILASKPRNLIYFRECGLLHTMLKYATAIELQLGSNLAKPSHFASACDEDFEFKYMLWVTLADVVKNSTENARIVSDTPFLQVLVLYIDHKEVHGANVWTVCQLRTLQILSLNILLSIAPLMPDVFLKCNGHSTLIAFLQKCTDHEARSIGLLACQQLINTPDMQHKFGSIGAVELMLDLFSCPQYSSPIRRLAVGVCGKLCRRHKPNQTRFRHANGIEIIGKHLYYEPAHAVSLDNVIIAVVGCVWAAIVGNPKNEILMIQSEGIDKLLDLLEICPSILHAQIISVLAELCENTKAIAYFQAWKSKTQCSATQLLLRMYIDEEKRLHADRPPNGVIQNYGRPLASHQTPENSIQDDHMEHLDSRSAYPAVAFVRLKQALVHSKGTRHTDPNRRLVIATDKVDMRSKIYAVLASVGFSCVKDELSFDEQMTMSVVKEFPVFSIGEAWLDVKMALSAQDIRPIYADALRIEKELEHVFSIVTHVRCNQEDILTQMNQLHATEEAAFFAGVRHLKEQERQAQSKKNVTVSSMKSHLEAKKRKTEMLRKSSLQGSVSASTVDDDLPYVFHDPPPIYNDL